MIELIVSNKTKFAMLNRTLEKYKGIPILICAIKQSVWLERFSNGEPKAAYFSKNNEASYSNYLKII